MCDQVSARVSIAFNDVAAYFSEEEWSRLEDWEKELYRSVMKEIHGALISLGYAIVNPDILLRIKQVEEPCGKDPQTVHCQRPQQSPQTPKSSQTQKSPQPQQLQQSQHLEKSEQLSDELEFVKALTPDHPFVKPDILLRIQQIEPVEETVVPEHWVFEAPARNPAPCFPVFQSVFQEDLKNEGQPCDSEEREGTKHSEIDYGSINIVTVTEVEDYPESASQHEASPDEVEEIIPVCFDDDDDDDDDDFHLPQMSLREKRFPPRYLMDGSFECDFQPDNEHITMEAVANSEEHSESTSQKDPSVGDAMERTTLYLDEQGNCRRLHRPVRHKRCPPKYLRDGSFECEFKDDELNVPSFGQRHYLEERLYHCPLCGKGFSEKEGVIKHYKRHMKIDNVASAEHVQVFMNPNCAPVMPSVEAIYQCDECDKSFSNSYKLRVHRRNHTGERPYKSPVCNKGFIMNAYLKFHQRIHTGERPYRCKVCGKGCTKSYHLKVHLRTHTGEKPYRCPECGRRFSVNSSLKTHLRTHSVRNKYLL